MYNNQYEELYHYGVKGQSWGVRRYQNKDGSLTPEGYIHYGRHPRNVKGLDNMASITSYKMIYDYDTEIKDKFKKSGLAGTEAQMKAQYTKNCKYLDVVDKMQNGSTLTAAEQKMVGKPDNSVYANQNLEKVKDIYEAKATTEEKKIYERYFPDKQDRENAINNDEWIRTNQRQYYSELYNKYYVEQNTERDKRAEISKTFNTMEGYTNNCPYNTLANELKSRGIKATAGCAQNADIGYGGLSNHDCKKIFGYENTELLKSTKGSTKKKPFVGIDPDNSNVIRLNCENVYEYKGLKDFKKVRKQIEKFANNTGIPNARFAMMVRGHICNAYTDANGKLFVRDGQVGEHKDIVSYMDSYFAGATLFRTDTAKINVAHLKKILKPQKGDYNSMIFLG